MYLARHHSKEHKRPLNYEKINTYEYRALLLLNKTAFLQFFLHYQDILNLNMIWQKSFRIKSGLMSHEHFVIFLRGNDAKLEKVLLTS